MGTQEEKPQRQKRRRVIVIRRYQVGAIWPVLLSVALFTLTAATLVLAPLYRDLSYEPDPVIAAVQRAQLNDLVLKTLPYLVLAAVVGMGVALLRTGRSAGPLYRLRQALLRLADGDRTPLQFRRGDHFHELAAVFNQLVEKSKENADRSASLLSNLRYNVQTLKRRLEQSETPRQEVIAALDTILRSTETSDQAKGRGV